MNAPAVIKAARSRPKKAASALAPAASLAGMRLWKDVADDVRVDPAKPGCLPASIDATEPTAAPDFAADAVPAAVPQVVSGPVAEAIETAAEAPILVVVAEGGLEPHVSPFPQRTRDERRKDSDILGYWARIRGDRAMPAWKDLDQNQIAYFWPNSFLMACISRGDHAPPMVARATRIIDDDGVADRSADLAFTAAMVSWIVRVSLDVATVAAPLDDRWTFPTESGEWMQCDLMAMPLSDTGRRVDHVLCHVKRV
jgi:hypothetical protein